jgi:cysteinyl-tRNA synthetase
VKSAEFQSRSKNTQSEGIMALKVFNSLTRQKEDFVSLVPGKVKMYCCGPTVYDFLHVGNFRGAVVYNLMRNWLEKNGYEVNFVYNFTDVDDKIIQRAITEKISAAEVAEKYIAEFKNDFASLKLRPHTHNPRVTEHMVGIIKLIERLIGNGKAYAVDGEVFFSIPSFKEYGKLSNRRPDDMLKGVRIEVDPKKKDSLDFTLWKPAKPGEQSWPSPWGDGRPGWHIECSCMTLDILGEQIDIHGGGMDLIFPHHENEIAQSEGASGKPYAKYWLHNNMFMFAGAKMSKSLGNIRTMRSFLEQYPGEVFKFLVLSAHYRSESEFSENTVENAISGLSRVYSALRLAVNYAGPATVTGKNLTSFREVLGKAQSNVNAAFDDDFNTPVVIAEIFEVVRAYNGIVRPGMKATDEIKVISQEFLQFVQSNGNVMAVFLEEPEEFLKNLDQVLIRQKNIDVDKVEELVKKRTQARVDKQYALSDQYRDELKAMGIDVRDAVSGSIWEVIK